VRFAGSEKTQHPQEIVYEVSAFSGVRRRHSPRILAQFRPVIFLQRRGAFSRACR
jgi:hypothetical protein